MVKFGVAASDELKIIGRLLTYKYRHAQGLVSNEFADVVDLLNVSLNGEAYNASHFPNDDAVGLLDSEDPERKTVRLCYGTDPELFVIQVIDNLIKTDGNEPLRAWLNGLPGKTPALTCSLNGLYTSKDSRDQVVHVDFPSDRKSKYLTILFNFECNTDVEGKVGTLTSQKSTVFVDDKRENAVSFSAEGVAFDGNEPLRAWLNGLPGKNPALTCSLNGLYTSKDSRDQVVHVDISDMASNWYHFSESLSILPILPID